MKTHTNGDIFVIEAETPTDIYGIGRLFLQMNMSPDRIEMNPNGTILVQFERKEIAAIIEGEQTL